MVALCAQDHFRCLAPRVIRFISKMARKKVLPENNDAAKLQVSKSRTESIQKPPKNVRLKPQKACDKMTPTTKAEHYIKSRQIQTEKKTPSRSSKGASSDGSAKPKDKAHGNKPEIGRKRKNLTQDPCPIDKKRSASKTSQDSSNKTKQKSRAKDPCPIDKKSLTSKASQDSLDKAKRKNRTQDSSPIVKKSLTSKASEESPDKTLTVKATPKRRKSKKLADEAPNGKPQVKKSKGIKVKRSITKTCTDSVTEFQQGNEASIQSMLLQHEAIGSQHASGSQPDMVSDADSSGSESDWEEVVVADVKSPSPKKSQLPSQSVEIRLEGPNLMQKKRKKGQFDLEEWFRLQVNRFKKESQTNVHKVHLLCLLANGCYRNTLCQDQLLRAVAMSLVPMEIISKTAGSWDLPDIVKFTRWFSGAFRVDRNPRKSFKKSALLKCLEARTANEAEYVLVFVLMGRSIGMHLRFLHSIQPVTSRASDLKPKKQDSEDKSGRSSSCDAKISHNAKSSQTTTSKKPSQATAEKPTKNQKSTNQDNHTTKKSSNAKTGKTVPHKEKSKCVQARDMRAGSAVQTLDAAQSGGPLVTKNKRPRACASKIQSLAEVESDVEVRSARHGKPASAELVSSEEDFEPDVVSFRSPTTTPKSRRKSSSDVRPVSPDSCDGSSEAVDYWAEVLINGQWICIDVVSCKVNKPAEMERNATQPLCYVMAYDNDGCVKDVTQKYAARWLSHTRRLRVDEEWWSIALASHRSLRTEVEANEDAHIQANLMKRPLPTVIGEYKNHPLYALRRHLLKFEAIYPDTAVPLGYIRKEPVYARECVQTLHSRNSWLKEARLVRIGETPYKLVKGRKTKKRMLTVGTEDPVLELFGHWQTEDYIPPPAFEGKVPRNEYGNVELFKPSMLPGGTVHLKGLPGLNRVAKKVGLDCVAAMTGWDAHCGYSHPVLDGWVVCEEHKDILLAAWDEEQEIIAEREAEKREKRVHSNWVRLIRGLLIKERLKRRYEVQEQEETVKPEVKDQTGSKSTSEQKATDVAMSWPRNRHVEDNSAKTNVGEHFVVEQL